MAPDPKIRSGEKAVDAAAKACRLTEFKSWYCLAAGAAAFAEVGEFGKAVRLQQMAIAQAPEHLQAEMTRRLALFKSRQPYRHRLPQATVHTLRGPSRDVG